MNIHDETTIRQEIASHIPRLRRFALGLCRNPQDADDMVQIALEKSLTRLHQFEPGTRLDSWLFRIVQTTWLDEQRRTGRRRLADAPETIDTTAGPSQFEASTLDLRKDIAKALDQLSDDQRALVLLVLVEGHSYDEAATTLGLPIGTVMSRLSRARQTLMKTLAANGIAP